MRNRSLWFVGLLCVGSLAVADDAVPRSRELSLAWEENILTVRGQHLPGKEVKIWYLEAYCRPGSTDRDWRKTVIGHETELVSADPNGTQLKLSCRLSDGVLVTHDIRVEEDAVEFRLVATNPTQHESQAHWAQPCIRVDGFTGRDQESYLDKSFVFLDGRPERLPTRNWATKARYTPGQVWCPIGVDRNDVNPRPLSEMIPTYGLIGCFSADDTMVLATAWEPYQELFQGVIVCLHSDFRIGGLKPGETKRIRGKLYLVDANVDVLLSRYKADFPEHAVEVDRPAAR